VFNEVQGEYILRRTLTTHYNCIYTRLLSVRPLIHYCARLREARQCAACITSSDHRSMPPLGTLVVSLKLVASSYRVEYRYNGRRAADGCGTIGSATSPLMN